MAIRTTKQQLEAVQAAIQKAELAIESGRADRRIVRERLDVLYKREDQLLARLRAETGSSGPATTIGTLRRHP